MTQKSESGSERFHIPEPDRLDERQRQMLEDFRRFSLNGDRGPFKVMLHSPEAADRFQALGKYLRFETTLSDRLVELAVLTHARIWHDQYEWFLHAPRAAEAGLPKATIEALRGGRVPASLSGQEAALFAFVRELEMTHSVSDLVYADALRELGQRKLADLVFMLGQYATISMMLALAQEGQGMEEMPPCSAPFSEA